MRLPVLLLALMSLSCALSASAQDIQYELANNWMWFEQDGELLRIPCLTSHRLDMDQPDITRVVVCVHGTLRNAIDYHAGMLEAVSYTGPQADSTLVITPQFLTNEDTSYHGLRDALCWDYYGWRQGDQSRSGFMGERPWDISSFALVDSMFLRAAKACPNLRDVVLTGHSAGGQVTNRYSASSVVPDQLREEFGVHYRGVVMNPSTYVYFSPARLREGSYDTFEIPSEQDIAACPTYDDYKYGLQNPNPWFTLEADTLRHRYSRRHVVHLVGEHDNQPVDWYLDTSCMANFQGTYRLDRCHTYWRYLNWFFGDDLSEQQAMGEVPGAGHHYYEMFPSDLGLCHLFDFGDCSGTPAEPLFTPVEESVLSTLGSHAVSWIDCDQDGNHDLFFAGQDNDNRLVQNDAKNGVFNNITPTLLHDSSYALATVWGDLDGNGHRDLVLLNYQGPGLVALQNEDGTFSDRTPAVLAADGNYTAADWGDFDLDGDLDLFVSITGDQRNLLLENVDGDLVSRPEIIDSEPSSTRGCAWGDLDGDGDGDLVLAENGRVTVLRNDRTAFPDVTCPTLLQTASYSGVALGDLDNDGDLDLYLAVRNGPNRLLHNQGDFAFTDESMLPAADTGNSRSASLADYDNDGWLDIYVANISGADHLLQGIDGTHFFNTTVDPMGLTSQSYGSAWGDHDRDGDLDIYVAVHGGTNYLYENKAAAEQHWLHVDLKQPGANSFAVGARVRCVVGPLSMIREIGGDETYMGQGTLTAEFGLGQATVVDSLLISWPDGEVQILLDQVIDQHLLVDRSATTAVPISLPGKPRLEAPYPNPFNPSVTVAFELPRAGVVDLGIFDARGRLVRSLMSGEALPAGPHATQWRGRDEQGRGVAAGVYWCRLSAGAHTDLRAVTLVK